MNRAAIDSMLTNSLGSTFSAALLRNSLEGGIDGLDFSDNLDISFDDFMNENVGNTDDSFRDIIIATLKGPIDKPATVGHAEKGGDVNMVNTETDNTEYDVLGSTAHSGPASMLSYNAAQTHRPRRRQTMDSAPEFRPETLRPPRRRVSTNSVPEFMPQMKDSRAIGSNPTYSFDDHDVQGDLLVDFPQRRRAEFGLIDSEMVEVPPRRHTADFNTHNFGTNEQLQGEIDLALHEAEDKIVRLRGLMGQDPQGMVMNDHVGGNNLHNQLNYQHTAPPPSRPGQTRSASERNLPWARTCPPEDNIAQIQQGQLEQITMAKLQAAMERTSSTMKLLQDWDRAHGLPASHCQTMVNSSRSRKQLKDGVVLKKWNGSPLVNRTR